MVYKTSGVCSSAISFEIDNEGKVRDVKFQGGCSGNTQGVAALVEGMMQLRLSRDLRESAVVFALLPARISWRKHLREL